MDLNITQPKLSGTWARQHMYNMDLNITQPKLYLEHGSDNNCVIWILTSPSMIEYNHVSVYVCLSVCLSVYPSLYLDSTSLSGVSAMVLAEGEMDTCQVEDCGHMLMYTHVSINIEGNVILQSACYRWQWQ